MQELGKSRGNPPGTLNYWPRNLAPAGRRIIGAIPPAAVWASSFGNVAGECVLSCNPAVPKFCRGR
jgi:hypothetical protein